MASDNRRITIREFADGGDISFLSCQAVFMDVLGITHSAANIVSKLLFERKQRVLTTS